MTFNLGNAIADAGKKVLLVDADPQCNLTELSLSQLLEDMSAVTVFDMDARSMEKAVFDEIYGRLGSVPRDRVKVIRHRGSGSNDGLSVVIASIKDLPRSGVTTLFSVSLAAATLEAVEDESETKAEAVEYICAVASGLADEFAQTDFQFYLMASARNNWDSSLGVTGQLSNSPFRASAHLLAEPVPWPTLPSRITVHSSSVRLVWFFPILPEERQTLGQKSPEQLRELLKGTNLFDLNR